MTYSWPLSNHREEEEEEAATVQAYLQVLVVVVVVVLIRAWGPHSLVKTRGRAAPYLKLSLPVSRPQQQHCTERGWWRCGLSTSARLRCLRGAHHASSARPYPVCQLSRGSKAGTLAWREVMVMMTAWAGRAGARRAGVQMQSCT